MNQSRWQSLDGSTIYNINPYKPRLAKSCVPMFLRKPKRSRYTPLFAEAPGSPRPFASYLLCWLPAVPCRSRSDPSTLSCRPDDVSVRHKRNNFNFQIPTAGTPTNRPGVSHRGVARICCRGLSGAVINQNFLLSTLQKINLDLF